MRRAIPLFLYLRYTPLCKVVSVHTFSNFWSFKSQFLQTIFHLTPFRRVWFLTSSPNVTGSSWLSYRTDGPRRVINSVEMDAGWFVGQDAFAPPRRSPALFSLFSTDCCVNADFHLLTYGVWRRTGYTNSRHWRQILIGWILPPLGKLVHAAEVGPSHWASQDLF